MPSLPFRVAAQHVVSRRGAALRSVVARGSSGGMPLPPEMADHPALTAGLTKIYPNPKEVGGYLGVIDGGSWIAFVGVDGKTELWTSREPKGGTIGNPYVFQRDDISSASTVTIPNPVFQFYSPIELKIMGVTQRVAARYKKSSDDSLSEVVERYMMATSQYLGKRLGGSKSGVMKSQFPKWKIGVSLSNPLVFDHVIDVVLDGCTLVFSAYQYTPGSTGLQLIKKATASVNSSPSDFVEVLARAYENQASDLY